MSDAADRPSPAHDAPDAASPPSPPEVGSIGWLDLTVPNAGSVRDFYAAVVGWDHTPVPMRDGADEYEDFCMMPPGSEAPVAGVCHARGTNAGLPATWMIYVVVANLDTSVAACTGCGGHVVLGPKDMPGHGRYAICRDPAGAAFGMFEYAKR